MKFYKLNPEEEAQNQQSKLKEQNKMADLNPKISVITLCVSGLSAPFQR